MSKDQLPTQKGTQTWPVTSKPPTVVRLHGVEPGSDQAAQLKGRFAAQIAHFHRSQAQKYSLSTVNNYRAHGRYDDIKMTYTNLAGQETIDVYIPGSVSSSEGRTEPKPEFYPDFAVVDIVVPNSAELKVMFSAALKIPGGADDVERDTDDPGAIPVDDYSAGRERPIIEFADPALATGSIDQSDRVASLKVDFRDLPSKVTVTIDVYGWLDPNPHEGDPYIIGYESGPTEVTVPLGPIETIPYREYWNVPAPTPSVYVAEGVDYYGFAAILSHYNAVADTYESTTGAYFDINGDLRFTSQTLAIWSTFNHASQGSLDYFDPGTAEPSDRGDLPHLNMSRYLSYMLLQVLSWEKIPVYDTDTIEGEERTADLTFAFYEPGQQFIAALETGHQEGNSAAMWLVEDGVAPERVKFGEIEMSSENNDPNDITTDNPMGIAFLGTLTLDRATRSVGWKPATE